MDYNLLCRICLKSQGHFYQLFGPDNLDLFGVPLLTKFIECCQLQASVDDGLPRQICYQCVNHVCIAYDLLKLSACSDAKLRKYLDQSCANFDVSSKDTKIPTDLNHTEEAMVLVTMENNSHPDYPETAAEIDSSFGGETVEVVEPITALNETTGTNRKKKKTVSAPKTSYSCSECDKQFQYKCHLKQHEFLHTGDRRFLCAMCGKAFAHKSSMTSHMKIHSDDKPYQCDMCPQMFRRHSHLTLHIRTHTGEKPFSCNECGRDFAQSSYLKEHMRLHSGEKPFVCEDCGHSFARRSSLVMHQRTHTGELPFPCPECDRFFSQRSQRKRHVKSKHKESLAMGQGGELLLNKHDKLKQLWKKTEEAKAN